MECHPSADNAFGPQVHHGCRSFDFTLLFENFLQIIPCALFLLLTPWRTSQLRKQNVKTFPTGARAVKLAAITALAGTQLALLIVWSVTPTFRTRGSIPAAVLSFLASLMLLVLSSMEHSRSIRPSTLINVFLFFSLLCDLPQARTLWLRRSGPRSLPEIFTAGVAAKSIILLLEARNKRRSLFSKYLYAPPEALVGLYNRLLVWWLNPLFWKGYSNLLSSEGLYPIDNALKAAKLATKFEPSWTSSRRDSKRRLLWTLTSSLRKPLLALVVPRLAVGAFKLSQPLLINRVTGLLAAKITEESINEGHGLIGAAALIYCGLAVANVAYERQLHRFLCKLRGTLITAIFAKILVTPSASLTDNSALTLINVDAQRIVKSLERIDDLFASPLEIGIAILLLERQIGVSCVAPLALSAFITTISFWSSGIAVPYQKKWLVAVQRRVAYISTVLEYPKEFKMLGLTEYLSGQIQALRVKELDDYAAFRKFASLRNALGSVPQNLAAPVTLAMFTLIHGGHALNSPRAFTTLSLCSLLAGPTANLIHAVPLLQQALGCIERIQDFLLLEEVPKNDQPTITGGEARQRVGPSDGSTELSVISPASIPSSTRLVRLEKATVVLGKDPKPVLQAVDLDIAANTLSLLIGPVGSGKSTLLRAIMGDLPLSEGHRIAYSGLTEFAYCSQDPWLTNDTVRNLVTGHHDTDDAWFETVVEACALQPDLATLPEGRDTLIGTRGISLSGGQRQRLALARAVYSRRTLLADDPLSGLDNSTASQVFEQVFGSNGLCKRLGIAVLLTTHNTQYLPQADHIVALDKNGSIAEQGSFSELEKRGGYVHGLCINFKDASTLAPGESALQKAAVSTAQTVDVQQDLARRTGDLAVYGYYAKSVGLKYGLMLLISAVGVGFGSSFPDLWLRWWAESETSRQATHHPLGLWIAVYILLASLGVVCIAWHIWIMLVYTVPKSSGRLHEQLLRSVMQAPYRFFVNTDVGVTLNRFSNDMALIEIDLSGAVMQCMDFGIIAIGSMALIMASSRYAAAIVPVILLVLYALQRFYLRTSRQLRFMDLEAKAPLVTCCQETLSGVTTIRAFGWQQQTYQRLMQLLDKSTSPFYLMYSIQRWLTLVLNLLTAAIAVIIVALAMALRGTSSAGSVGVGLVNVTNMQMFLSILITAWTQLETSLGAVTRCRNFEKDTLPEDLPGETHTPEPEWPQRGALRLHELAASYDTNAPAVLKSLSLSVAPGSKVGICGRSGSGKSSLLLTLARLLDLSSGNIVLDGVDLATVPRQIVRERITVLPQASITFPGTVRNNIDPIGKHTDEELRLALEKVGLLSDIDQRGGLEADIDSIALSHGQRQLFAVARTILKKTKLLLLDEMTSSVDAVTEERIMDIINDEFRDSTVIAIAHRLKTIVNYDKVVVMSEGRIAEVGAPVELLGNTDGLFRALWERSGS